jgi:hypothetical protein
VRNIASARETSLQRSNARPASRALGPGKPRWAGVSRAEAVQGALAAWLVRPPGRDSRNPRWPGPQRWPGPGGPQPGPARRGASHFVGGHYLGGEPAFAPNPTGGGAVICQRFDAEKNESAFLVFDAFNVAAGPVAVLPLAKPVHLGFHAVFHPEPPEASASLPAR